MVDERVRERFGGKKGNWSKKDGMIFFSVEIGVFGVLEGKGGELIAVFLGRIRKRKKERGKQKEIY